MDSASRLSDSSLLNHRLSGSSGLIDPSLEGNELIFSRLLSIEVRNSESPSDPGEETMLELRLLRAEAGGRISMQLLSPQDLFFHLGCFLSEEEFTELKKEQSLCIEFSEFPSMLAGIIDQISSEGGQSFAVLQVFEENVSTLNFVRNLGYKLVTLLALDFSSVPEETVKDFANFRYRSEKSKSEFLKEEVANLNRLIKLKHPSLALQLKKAALASVDQDRENRYPSVLTRSVFRRN